MTGIRYYVLGQSFCFEKNGQNLKIQHKLLSCYRLSLQ